jgi:hypothetical protein
MSGGMGVGGVGVGGGGVGVAGPADLGAAAGQDGSVAGFGINANADFGMTASESSFAGGAGGGTPQSQRVSLTPQSAPKAKKADTSEPTKENVEAEARTRRGRSSTLFTSPLGIVSDSAGLERKVLLRVDLQE